MKNKLTFTTILYERSNLRKPSGLGHWLFEADFGETSVQIAAPLMTHSQAKAFAIKEARAIAVREEWTGSIEVATLP